MNKYLKKGIAVVLTCSMLVGISAEKIKGTECVDELTEQTESSQKTQVEFEGEGYKVSFQLTDSWDGGYNAKVSVVNTGNQVIENWKLMMDYEGEIGHIWSAEIESKASGTYIIKNATWNQDIAAGNIIEFGISGKGDFSGVPSFCQMIGGYEVVPEQNYKFDYEVPCDWNSGFIGNISIKNDSEKMIEDWFVEFDYDRNITNIWNATIVEKVENHYVIKNADYNSNIKGNQIVSFGFSGENGNEEDVPKNIVLYSYNSDVAEDPDADSDGDGLKNSMEAEYGMDSHKRDTLKDGVLDGDRFYDVKRTCEKSEADEIVPVIELSVKGRQIDELITEKVSSTNELLDSNIPGSLGSAYDFSLDGEYKDAKISFEISKTNLNSGDKNPTIYRFDEETQLLEELPTQSNENVVWAEVDRLGKYILLDKTEYTKNAFKETISAPVTDEIQNVKYDVTFVLDESGSISTSEFRTMKKQCLNLIDCLDDNDEVAIYAFSSSARKITDLVSPETAKEKLNSMVQRAGNTAIYDAAYKAMEQFYKNNTSLIKPRKVMILLTDGADISSKTPYTNVIKIAKDMDVAIYTIGIGVGVSPKILGEISKETGGQYYSVNNFNQLDTVFEQILEDEDLYKDSDGDGISDYHEKRIAVGEMQIGTGKPLESYEKLDYLSADSDGDGLADGEEIKIVENKTTGNYYVYVMSNPCINEFE